MKEEAIDMDWRKVPKITQESYNYLISVAKWAKFLAIVAFVFLALFLLAIPVLGFTIDGMNQYMSHYDDYPYAYNPGVFSWTYAIIAIIVLVICFIPAYLVYKFAARLRKALDENDTAKLTESFHFLQRYYKFIGIFTIVVLALYVLGVAGMLVVYWLG